jgi:hypothetical protein
VDNISSAPVFFKKKNQATEIQWIKFFRLKIYFSTYFHLKYHKNLPQPSNNPKTL